MPIREIVVIKSLKLILELERREKTKKFQEV